MQGLNRKLSTAMSFVTKHLPSPKPASTGALSLGLLTPATSATLKPVPLSGV